ncbi:MAG: hypothetical protein R3C11_28145 [Planctomycetaceae bacterium]
MRRLLICFLILSMTMNPVAKACIWDDETIAIEKTRFPDLLELIVGYFGRHSSDYYQWRIQKYEATKSETYTARDYDNLAGYEKTGEPSAGHRNNSG